MVKNIVFDLGGVLLTLDMRACINSFTNLGYSNFEEILSETLQKGFFLEFEEGKINLEEFNKLIRANSSENVSDELIEKAMSSFLIGIDTYKLKFLEALKQSYNLFMLSNTNPLAMKIVNPMFEAEGKNIKFYFNKLYLSYQLGVAKPNNEIFQLMTSDAGFLPEETLFIDDSPKNLESASRLGFLTLKIDSQSNFEEDINNCLNSLNE